MKIIIDPEELCCPRTVLREKKRYGFLLGNTYVTRAKLMRKMEATLVQNIYLKSEVYFSYNIKILSKVINT